MSTKTTQKPPKAAPQPQAQAVIVPPAGGVRSTMTPEQVELIKRTICADATDDELQLFLMQCARTGLDPFSRQIHAVRRQGKMIIQTGIDGYRLIADRTGRYVGNDDPIFDDDKKPKKATATVWKLVGGVRHPFTASARWSEYYPGQKLGFMWDAKPCVMLGKVAEALALRKAFPAELSGLYVREELPEEEAVSSPAVPAAIPPTPKGSTPEGVAFMAGLKDYDEQLVGRGLPLAGGDLIAYVVRRGKEAHFPPDVVAWGEPQLRVARGWIKECEKELSRVRIAALLAETGWTLDDVRTEVEMPQDATPQTMTLKQLRGTIECLEGAAVEAG